MVGCAAAPAEDADETNDELRAVLGAQSLDPNLPTRLLLIGDSAHLGDTPTESALARARRYKEAFPGDQVVLYLPDEATTASVKKYDDLKPVQADYSKMRSTQLVQSLTHFNKIVSIDFYGHSSPFALSLDHTSVDTNLRETTPNIGELTAKFDRSRNAFATFNGCNAGERAAQLLAVLWKIPVAGAFTGSQFERLHSDGHWYADIAGEKPTTGSFVTTNSSSYKSAVQCSEGACWRMRPMNYAYNGYYGKFDLGLGHYKFFCGSADDTTCAKGMAESLLGFPSVKALGSSLTAKDRADFEAVVLDYLCPTSEDPATFDQCVTALRGGAGFTPFSNPAKAASCDMHKCNAELTCKLRPDGNPVPGTCTLKGQADTAGATTPEEYRWFMKGFDLLKH